MLSAFIGIIDIFSESSEAVLPPQQLPDTAPPQEAMLAATGRTVLEIHPEAAVSSNEPTVVGAQLEQESHESSAQLHVAQIVQEQPSLETVDVASHDEGICLRKCLIPCFKLKISGKCFATLIFVGPCNWNCFHK